MLQTSLFLTSNITSSAMLEMINQAVMSQSNTIKAMTVVALAKTVINSTDSFNINKEYANFKYSARVEKGDQFIPEEGMVQVLKFRIEADLNFKNNNFLSMTSVDLETMINKVKEDFMAEIVAKMPISAQ